MRVALTGTPGTGKSAVGTELQAKGYNIIRLHELAKQTGCITGVDTKRNTNLVDIPRLNKYIKTHYPSPELQFFEGHIAHLLRTMEKVILLRCHPQELRKRLQKRNWSAQKIKENSDAEALDIILCEAVDLQPKKNIMEIDTTRKTIGEVTAVIEMLIARHFQPTTSYSIGTIDWSEEILTADPFKE